MTKDDLLRAAQARADQHLRDIPDRLAKLGLPDALAGEVTAGVALALSGVRLALTRFTPRPPVTDADEEVTLLALVDDLIAARVSEVYAEFVDWQAGVVGRTAKALATWQRERPVVAEDRPTAAARKAMSDGERPDTDHFAWRENPDGSRSPVYTVRPEKGDR